MPGIVVAQEEWSPKPGVAQDRFYCTVADNVNVISLYLYYKRRSLYLCSAKAPQRLRKGSAKAPQRLRFYRALGVAACTIGKVRASTVFMCVCSMFRPSDFLLFVKNGFAVGCVAKVTTSHLLMARPRHCLSATHGWPSLNNSQCSSPTLYTHSVY